MKNGKNEAITRDFKLRHSEPATDLDTYFEFPYRRKFPLKISLEIKAQA